MSSERKELFHGKRFNVVEIQVSLPQKKPFSHHLVEHPGAAVILPLIDKENVLLIRNERYGIQKKLWELPAGVLEKAESPHQCAARELVEETGYQAAQLTPLLHFFSTPGFCNEKLYVYLAEELTYKGQQLESAEEITVVPLPFLDTLQMIQSGEICDGKTICSLLYYHQFKYKK